MEKIPAPHRSDYLDRIRVMLTILVILHHTAIMFGGDGGWYLRYDASSTMAKALLTLLCAIDQSFFMGTFFLLAGYFTPRSFDSKGWRRFGIDRLVRLGLPLLVYGFLIGPLTIALSEPPNTVGMLEHWGVLIGRFTFNIGPLWFAYALLIFSAAYALLRTLIGQHMRVIKLGSLRHSSILAIVLIWGAGAFLLRLWVPTGQEFGLLQIGYFSSYILLFAIGCAAAPARLLEQIEAKLAVPWGWISLLSIPTLFIYAALSGAFDGKPFEMHGGWTLPVTAYAFWEPMVGCGIILMLLWRCRVAKNPAPILSRLAPYAYGAFIIHPPVVVSIGLILEPWEASSLLKFAVSGVLAATASFALASAIVRLPGARRVL
ncbi:MAG: acyltransferase family protein [Burkholderiales bacterium]|nr:acyltransferase family protein [Burkholderiales bacterium]